MKMQDTLVRLKQFHVEEKRRRVAQIEAMVEEFSRIARELDQEVSLEEQRAGIFDSTHFAYPTYARAARTRRDNLNRSAQELAAQLEDARDRLFEAMAELEKAQGFGVRDLDAVEAPVPQERPVRLRAQA
jgi:flagellar protein FliJ